MISLETKNGTILLNKGQNFGLTNAVSDFGKIETRQGITSNSFDIPKTASNMQKLGFSNLSQANDNVLNPYRKIECVIKKNGNFIAKGFLQITSFDDKNIVVDFFGGNTEWYKELGNIKINEITQLQNFIHIWNSSNVVLYSDPAVTNRAFLYPIISNGKQKDRSSIIFFDKELYPAFFVKKLLELVFQNAGYSFGGDFYESSIFSKLILPYSNSGEPKPDKNEIDKRKYAEQKTINYVETFTNGTYSRVINLQYFTGNILQTGDFNGVGYFCYYDNYYITFPNFEFFFSGGSEIPITNLQIRVTTNAGVFTQAFGAVTFFAGLKDKTILAVDLLFDITLTTTLTANILYKGNTIYPNLDLTDLWNTYVNPAWFLPNITIADLLKSLANQFGLYFFTDFFNKKVYIRTLQKTISKKNESLDYTNKLVSNDNEIDFTKIVEKYFKTSFFDYKETPDDELITNYNNLFGYIKNLGQGILNIDNDFIESQGTIFTSVFAPTICSNTFDNTTYLPIIPIFDELGNAKNPNPRILILGEEVLFSQISDSPEYEIEGEGNFSSLFFCYFSKKNIALNDYQNLTFGKLADGTEYGFSLQDTYLKDLTRILQKPFLLKAKFLFSEADYQNFDFSKLIYLGNPYYSYFFVNRIVEFGNDDLTELELIKV